jgi:energy-coupling factor transporter transmembrane protein EcfT
MYNELRKKAKKRVEAKKAFYICIIVFSFTTIILLLLSFYLPWIAFWLMLPIPVFIFVLSILYFFAFGFPFSGVHSEDWEEDEIEKEIIRLYRQRRVDLPPLEELSESDKLELKELERLKKKWDWGEDYV